ncbi:PhzF family phenazine biosynthesis protein [Spirosoma areae]
MERIIYYIVDVFASSKYEGNQLAVFLDLTDKLSENQMQQMAQEINFAETTFIKSIINNQRFVVRIFTPEHEVPFAGHPSIGTSYIIAKFLLPDVTPKLTLALAHSDIEISILDPDKLDESIFFMRQAQPEFRDTFSIAEVADGLKIKLDDIETSLPIQEISTGLPYIIIPLKNLAAMERLSLTYESFKAFLLARNKYRTNSLTGHSTSLFFFTTETYEPANTYNTRMLLLENNKLSEDAATGSANGCFLAYLLKHKSEKMKATVEQGFQMGRKSYVYLDGELANEMYQINVGGRTKLISEGVWYV